MYYNLVMVGFSSVQSCNFLPVIATCPTCDSGQPSDLETLSQKTILGSEQGFVATKTQQRNIAIYEVHRDTIYRKCQSPNPLEHTLKVFIPKTLRRPLVLHVHTVKGHFGARKCVSYLKRYDYSPGLDGMIRSELSSYGLCQWANYTTKSYIGEFQVIIPEGSNQFDSVDLYVLLPKSKRGVTYLFIICDVFSKLCRIYSIKKATVEVCIRKVQGYVQEVGCPRALLTDHETQLTAKMCKVGEDAFDQLFEEPQGQPMPERELIQRKLTLLVKKRLEWAGELRKKTQRGPVTQFKIDNLVLLREAPVSNFWGREIKTLFLVYSGLYELTKVTYIGILRITTLVSVLFLYGLCSVPVRSLFCPCMVSVLSLYGLYYAPVRTDQPLRVLLHYDDSVYRLDAEKFELINNTVLPEAVQFWERALMVRKTSSVIRLNR
uniref:Integrase catalytic domain-containing protein n=1 Tax=Timema genevievae TaxID=629358 RepID=A0A7R9JUP9_TIMGE|nr:unnamed protein product [Timema genevievae]